MIKKLKKKFIILATVSVFVLMTILVSVMNIINYSSVVAETDTILDVLSQPNAPFGNQQDMLGKPPEMPNGDNGERPQLPDGMQRSGRNEQGENGKDSMPDNIVDNTNDNKGLSNK